MATLNQWRLVLNEVPDSIGDLPDAPTFDETRHASICAEVCCLPPSPFFHSIPLFMFPRLAVEISLRRSYSGSEQPLDRG